MQNPHTAPQSANESSLEAIQWPLFGRLVLIAAVGAAVVNAIIYAIGSAANAFSPDVQTMGTSLNLGQVVIVSIVGVAAAGLALVLIDRLTDRTRGIFLVVATTALIVSLLTPVNLQGVTVAMAVTLMSMHVVAYAFSVLLLPRSLR